MHAHTLFWQSVCLAIATLSTVSTERRVPSELAAADVTPRQVLRGHVTERWGEGWHIILPFDARLEKAVE